MDYYIARHKFDVDEALGEVRGFQAFTTPTEMGSGPQFCPFCNRVSAEEWHVSPAVFRKEPMSDHAVYEFHFSETNTECMFAACREGDAQPPTLQLSMRSDSGGQPLSLDWHYGSDTASIYPNGSEADLRFALWYAFAMMASSAATTLIHSATIVHKDHAVLFLGESGTGKSTHARLWTEHVPDAWLLNDDSPALSLSSGSPLVFGTPWSGKTPCYHNIGYPLLAVVRLEQRPYNAIRRLSPLEALSAILPSLPPAFAYEECLRENMMVIAERVVEAVPVFLLGCLPHASAADLCAETLDTLIPHSS